MFLENCKIIENKKVDSHYYLMKIESATMSEASKPGQFFMFRCKNGINILRRPISLHNVDKENGILEFYYEVKGKGTEEFSKMKIGELLDIQGPLGNGFSHKVKNKTVLLIGGGMGLAPMKYLLHSLANTGNRVIFIAGGRNSGALKILDNFNLEEKNIELHIMSDDGSAGEKGNVIEKMREVINNNQVDRVYSCGPHRMMELVGEIANKKNIWCEISLEERMACGVKACVGCSIKTLDGMKKVCHEGPVFDSKIIVETMPIQAEPCSCI
ncbi:MAG: dihydroorotate dehydrogenase electron transfer subunit [Fusobacteriaceae bacterium]